MESMTIMKENFQGISISVFNLGSRFVFSMLIYVHVSIFLYNFPKWVWVVASFIFSNKCSNCFDYREINEFLSNSVQTHFFSWKCSLSEEMQQRCCEIERNMAQNPGLGVLMLFTKFQTISPWHSYLWQKWNIFAISLQILYGLY